MDDVDEQALGSLLSRLEYIGADAEEGPTTDCATRSGTRRRRSSPRDASGDVPRGRRGAGGADLVRNGRLVVEKPFGTDLRSARELNARLTAIFPEDRLYRIDHFLGKGRCRTSCTSASRTRSSSRSGTESTSSRSRSRWPRTSASRRGSFYDQGRRDPRRPPEPPAAGARADRDGAALGRPRRDPAAPGGRLPGDAGGGSDARSARPVRGLPRRRGRRVGLGHGDVRRSAPRDRELALGGYRS